MTLSLESRESFKTVVRELKEMALAHHRNWELLSATNIPEELDRRRDLVRKTVGEYEIFTNLDRIAHELQTIVDSGGI